MAKDDVNTGPCSAFHVDGWPKYWIEILIYREGSKLRGPHLRSVNPAYLQDMLADKNLKLVKMPDHWNIVRKKQEATDARD